MVRKIVLVSTSPFPYGDNITDGPGYRAWNLFERISEKHQVVILSLYESYHQNLRREFDVSTNELLVKCISHRPRRVFEAISNEKPDVLYVPWSATPFISRLNYKIPTIVDYVGVGMLEQFVSLGSISANHLNLKIRSFWTGDFLMTAGTRERYYLIGLLVASRRLSAAKKELSSPLIHLIPMTPPSVPPTPERKVIERENDEFVILVGGAFLPWYDYQTLFRALDILSEKGKRNFKCVIFGGNPRDPSFERLILSMGLKSRLRGHLVFTGIVPFKNRADYYLQSDVAINIPLHTVEDELSVRTRIMDYIWAKLPIVTPGSDEHSEIVLANGGGFRYLAGNPHSLSDVLQELMEKQGLERIAVARRNMEEIYRRQLDIKDSLRPLEDFFDKPYVDRSRASPRQYLPEFLILGRDMLRWLKRGVV